MLSTSRLKPGGISEGQEEGRGSRSGRRLVQMLLHGTQGLGARLGVQSAISGIKWRWGLASVCLEILVPQLMLRASRQRRKGWKSLGRRRRGGSELGAVRLEAVKSGKVGKVLLNRGVLSITGRDGNCNSYNSYGKTPYTLSQSRNFSGPPGLWVLQPVLFSGLGCAQSRLWGSRGVGPARAPAPLLSPPAAPHFPEPLGDVAVEVGDSVSLLCRVEGSPLPRISWSRQDGKPVTGWHGPPGVSSQLEAAELLIDSKRAECASVCWHGRERTRASHPGTCLQHHPWVLSPCPLQAAVPAVALAPVPTPFAVVKR